MRPGLAAEPTRLNYSDFCALPDDGRRYEILDGNLYMSPSPQTSHQRVLRQLGYCLHAHVEKHELGEVFLAPYDVVLGDNDIVEPDIIFVGHANREIIQKENIRGIPDLVVEILSPTRPTFDTLDKRNVYARCGVPYYWLVDPQHQRLTELQLAEKAYNVLAELTGPAVFQPRLFPGLDIDLARVWA